jgi:GNAT superfamily N-acetyltransferase
MIPTIEPLAAQHKRARAAFSCGEASLDTYLRQQAGQDMRRNLAACYVLAVPDGSEILGYYTLSATSVAFTDLPPHLAKEAARYPVVPAVLLGRLAVDSRHHGQGLSTILLVDALRRTLRTGIGIQLVIVDALDERVVSFYERREFRRFADSERRLYLPMSKVRDMFPEDVAALTGARGSAT